MIGESKLNWSYDRPKFEDVEGKMILVEYKTACSEESYYDIFFVNNENCYKTHLDRPNALSRYAIIDTAEEPLPLDGVIPKTNETTCWVDIDGIQICGFGNTRQEAINKYNKLVRRLK